MGHGSLRISFRLKPPGRFACLVCREVMELTQPNSNDPDLLIGSCNECERLYMIETSEDEAMVGMTQLHRQPEHRVGTPRSR